MKKILVLVIIAASLLLCAIISGVVLAGINKVPDGLSALESMIEGCNKKSADKIIKSFYINEFSDAFSGCKTPDDYLIKCGISFGYMDNTENVTQKFYLVGAASEENSGVSDSEYSIDESAADFSNVKAYVAADYKDADGNLHTVMTTVSFTAREGKIFYIL